MELKKDERKGVHMSHAWRERAGENIRLLREQRGWTQLELLKRLRDISGESDFYKDKSAIAVIEKGMAAPPWDKMLQIARLLGTTLERLAGLDPAQAGSGPPTITVQGNAYNDSVIVGGANTTQVIEQLLEGLRTRGVLIACPLCVQREHGQPQTVPEDHG